MGRDDDTGGSGSVAEDESKTHALLINRYGMAYNSLIKEFSEVSHSLETSALATNLTSLYILLLDFYIETRNQYNQTERQSIIFSKGKSSFNRISAKLVDLFHGIQAFASPSLADDVDPSAALASTPGHGLQLQCFPFSIPWYTDATCLPQPFQVNLPHLLHSTL